MSDTNATYNLYFENSASGVMKRSGMVVDLQGQELKQALMKVSLQPKATFTLIQAYCYFCYFVVLFDEGKSPIKGYILSKHTAISVILWSCLMKVSLQSKATFYPSILRFLLFYGLVWWR